MSALKSTQQIQRNSDIYPGTPMENCKLCDEPTDNLVKDIETSVINMIREHRPEWVEADGSCEKCISYYENLDKLIVQDD